MARITDYRHRGSKTGEDLTRMTERYGAEIILSNATTLLEDAKILRKSRRYARALGLAVLSIEELGKFIISARPWEVPNTRNAVRLHKQKQRAAGNAVIGTMLLSEIEKIASLKRLRSERLFFEGANASRRKSSHRCTGGPY